MIQNKTNKGLYFIRVKGFFYCILYKIVNNKDNSYILTTFEKCNSKRSDYSGVVFIDGQIMGEIVNRSVSGDEKVRSRRKKEFEIENINICRQLYPELTSRGLVKDGKYYFNEIDLKDIIHEYGI